MSGSVRGVGATWVPTEIALVRYGKQTCQSMREEAADAAVSVFIIKAVNRENMALTLAVQQQVRADFAAVDQQCLRRIEALRYQADLARGIWRLIPGTGSWPPLWKPTGTLV